jgi:hypothetical protein
VGPYLHTIGPSRINSTRRHTTAEPNSRSSRIPLILEPSRLPNHPQIPDTALHARTSQSTLVTPGTWPLTTRQHGLSSLNNSEQPSIPNTLTMAFDLWTHQFCLSCDKQTDGATYCSESCRLADFEKTSSPSSSMSSPNYTPLPSPHSAQQPSRLYLSPSYDFNNAQPYGRTPLPQSHLASRASSVSTPSSRRPQKTLTPSSSHSSLCSIQSHSSTSSEAFHLSEKSKKELQAYAVSFEHVRVQRRRSY